MPLPRRCPLKTSFHTQQMLLEKRGIPISRNKAIGLIKWGKTGLDNLLVSYLLQKKNYGGGLLRIIQKVTPKPSPFIELVTYLSLM